MVREELCEPLVPVTVKLRELPVTVFRLLTVSTLLCPAVMLAGLNEHAAGALPEQLRSIAFVKLNEEEAEMLNTTESVPLITVAEVLSAIIENPRTPTPDRAID